MIDEIYQRPVTEWPDAILEFIEQLLLRLDSHYDLEVKSYVRREVAHRLTTAAPDVAYVPPDDDAPMEPDIDTPFDGWP